MRSATNRIFHALTFEALGLILVTPLAALVMGKPLHEIGVVTLVSTVTATIWTFGYNLAFDHALLRLRGTPEKTPALRLLHAGLFELGLLATLLPFAAWWLGIGLWQAFLLDLVFVGFYLVYAFVFNWVWDRQFPFRPAGQHG